MSSVAKSPNWTIQGLPPPEKESGVPGPGAYGVQNVDTTSRFIRGPHFAFGSSGREVISSQKMPGPGAYALRDGIGRQGRAYSMSPRRPVKKPQHLDNPGPGSHDVRSRIGEGPKFSASLRAGRSPEDTGPGPGDYAPEYKVVAVGSPRCTFGMALPSGLDKSQGTWNSPGPGAYGMGAVLGTDSPKFSMKHRHMSRAPDLTPGPGAHGGLVTSLGDYSPGASMKKSAAG